MENPVLIECVEALWRKEADSLEVTGGQTPSPTQILWDTRPASSESYD